MDRACFTLRIAPQHLERYAWMHERAWPELLRELHRTGWRDYTLHLRDDGLLVGSFASDDVAASRAAMDATPVAARWSVEMDRLVVPGSRMHWIDPAAAPPLDARFRRVFDLERQLLDLAENGGLA